jgi:hypothetical protein
MTPDGCVALLDASAADIPRERIELLVTEAVAAVVLRR